MIKELFPDNLNKEIIIYAIKFLKRTYNITNFTIPSKTNLPPNIIKNINYMGELHIIKIDNNNVHFTSLGRKLKVEIDSSKDWILSKIKSARLIEF